MSGRTLTRTELAWLVLLTLCALAIRVHGVGSISLAEDEAGKWQAIQEYRQGHFVGVNAEHPMLMKVLAWGTSAFGAHWNGWAAGHPWLQGSEEAWLRLPNLIFGALTTAVIYLLARQMMGSVGAGAAAVFWALSPLAISQNRILKEDTLLTFFTLLAFYFFWRAKQADSEKKTVRWVDLCSIAFGLSFASKYIVYLFGMNWAIWPIAGRAGLDHKPLLPYFWRHVAVIGLVFVLANPVILFPSNLAHMLHWAEGHTLEHHGYNLDGRLYLNNFANTPFGLPFYFYLWVLAVKTPLLVLAGFAVGAFFLLRNQNSMASIFFRCLVLICLLGLSVMGGKWIRYTLSLLPFVFMAAGYGYQRAYDWYRSRTKSPLLRPAFAVVVLAGLGWMLADTLAWDPYYQLYLNAFGGGRKNIARFFPHDEVYDLNAQQEIATVCRVAPLGGTVAVSNPMGAGYYMQRCGRRDLRLIPLYDVNYLPRTGDLLVLGEARRYFETQDLFDLMERTGAEHQEVYAAGRLTSHIYHFPSAATGHSGASAAAVPAGLASLDSTGWSARPKPVRPMATQ
jgi:4-amino-4-deoxy-L-arabinose transferase-like glycosyltransferase